MALSGSQKSIRVTLLASFLSFLRCLSSFEEQTVSTPDAAQPSGSAVPSGSAAHPASPPEPEAVINYNNPVPGPSSAQAQTPSTNQSNLIY
jgi:hypothetical protein